jgi:hypothetical protein
LFDWIIGLYPRELIPDEESSTSDNSTSDNSTSNNTTSDNTTSDNTTSDNTTSDNRDSLIEKLSKLSLSRSESLTRTDSNSTLDTSTSNSSLNLNKYLSDGRLINGIENMFKLPKPIDLIRHNFFEELTIKPKDFDEKDAIYFRAGF